MRGASAWELAGIDPIGYSPGPGSGMAAIQAADTWRRLNAVFMFPEYTCRLGPARPGTLPITSMVSLAPGTGPPQAQQQAPYRCLRLR